MRSQEYLPPTVKQFLLLFLLFVFINSSCKKSADKELIPTRFRFAADLTLTPTERKADSILNDFRAELLTRKGSNWALFTSFAGSKEEIQQEPLYRIFKEMPKGGMLHIHASATADVKWLIELALSTPDCYIYWGAETDSALTGQLKFFPDHNIPAGWLPIHQLYEKNPHLPSELFRLYTFGPEDEYRTDIWTEFEKMFSRVDGFISYRPVFLKYYQHSFEILAADGIQFVELRTSFDPILNEDGTYTGDGALVSLYQKVLQQVKLNYPSFTATMIVCSWRGASLNEVNVSIEKTAKLHSDFPEMIVGFDLVGEEELGHSNGFYTPSLLKSPVPLFLHGGESLSASNFNILDAVNLHAPRISHAINLFYFPDLESTLISNKTLLELCPISNQSLHYVRDFRLHPARGYLQKGIQATLGSDDPTFMQSQGLTDDYFVAYLAWGIDLNSLKKLMLNSIICSGQSPSLKQHQLDFFISSWNHFILDVNLKKSSK